MASRTFGQPFGLLPSSFHVGGSANLHKPLTRATINAYNIHLRQQQQQQQQTQGRYYATYYYRFPKIPRPKRNVLYYKVTSISIVGSIGSKLKKPFSARQFSTAARDKNGKFIANTKKLFSPRRRYASSGNQSQSQSQQQSQQSRYRFPRRINLRSWFTLTSISIIFFGVVARNGQIEKEEQQQEDRPVRPFSWPVYLYSRLPFNALSRLWGQVNNIELPEWLRGPGFKFYGYVFGVNFDEMADPTLEHYKNLGEFFYRKIRPEVRPVDKMALLCSPCDGRVLKFGSVSSDGEIEQVKGMTYKLDALLGATDTTTLAAPRHEVDFTGSGSVGGRDAEFVDVVEKEGDQALTHASSSRILEVSKAVKSQQSKKYHQDTQLFFAVIYLAPGDYHRFHSPVDWVATLRRHFVGELYSVAPYFQRTLNNLFVLNERVALLGYWKYGFFSMTPVGATNVGSIKLNFDSQLSTNEVYEHEMYTQVGLLESAEKEVSNALARKQEKQERKKKLQKSSCYEATYSKASALLHGQPLFKGEEMGGFKLGSTVVLVFEAPSEFKFDLTEGQRVEMGQRIGS